MASTIFSIIIIILQWLKDFLVWLDDWEAEVKVIDCPEDEKSRMMISKETRTGIRITDTYTRLNYVIHLVHSKQIFLIVRSFTEMVPYLFTIPNVTSFLSERISQDPLEKFFGRQRMRGGVNDNPNVAQFLINNMALRTINTIHLDVVLGNCRGRNQKSLKLEKENFVPLRKRRKLAKGRIYS